MEDHQPKHNDRLHSSYKSHRFNTGFSNFNKKRLFIILGSIIGLAIIIFLIFFISAKTAEPGIKMVSGTEYISGEEGQVIVRLDDSRNVPIDDANCILSLLYPDKSFFLIDIPMNPTTVPGNYYHSFTTPEREGIYEEHIRCTIIRGDNARTLNISYSFHVSTGLNLIREISISQREQYDDLVERVGSLDSNLSYLQSFIDENVMSEMNQLGQSISDINNSLNSSLDGIESRLNETMLTNFEELYDKFRDSYGAMADIFGTGE